MNFKNLPDGGLRKIRNMANALPRAKKRILEARINSNLVSNTDLIDNKITQLVSLMNVHKQYTDGAETLGTPKFNKLDIDEMKKQYNDFIIDIENLSFTPYVL